MRTLLAFLVWLFSFWTWKDFFVRWLWNGASHPAGGETAGHLLSQEAPQESELARFLGSLPEDGRQCDYMFFNEDSEVSISFGAFPITLLHGPGVEASYRAFLEAVAASEIHFLQEVSIELHGDASFKHVEAFADALRQSGKRFRKLELRCQVGSAVRFAKCVSSVLIGNDAIQDLGLILYELDEELGRELAAEFMAIIAVPHNLRTLKTLAVWTRVDGEGMGQLMKPFQGPPNGLEELKVHSLTSGAQLEHISGVLASSTSLKRLAVFKERTGTQKALTRGFSSIAAALCSNQSLEALTCDISSSMELKVLLDPLIPKDNNLQRNSTLTKLHLIDSIGGREGVETLVDMLCTNTTLLELGLTHVDDLSLDDPQGVENVLAILEALKTNKSLKIIDFTGCKAVGGYKVLGAMMDLLLENHNIQNIDLGATGLRDSGDDDYVFSALSRRRCSM